MSDIQYDLVIIGAGPGGYTGAIRAAQLGLKTAVIEKDPTLGGTCLNVGCIPSKALLDSSEHYHTAIHDFADHGILIQKPKLDIKAMIGRKSQVVKELTDGIDFLFKKNKIDRVNGFGKITGPNSVQVTAKDGSIQSLQAKNIMISTGSVVNELPFLKFDGQKVISSTEALELTEVPKKLAVIGAGAIGLELGSVWLRLGSEVTVIEYADKICGPMDAKLSKRLQTILKKQGMNIVTGAKVESAEIKPDGCTLTYEILKTKKIETLAADIILVAAGRMPFTDNLGLKELGIETNERGFIPVNAHWQTKYDNIFAVGDVIPGPMLAHVAEEEGVAVAEFIATGHGHVNYATVPGVIYTWPEFSAVGLTEEDCKSQGLQVNIGTFPFTANGRAKALNCTEGQVKVIADKTTDKVLGVHIIGPRASDILAECVVLMEFGGSSEDLARCFHAHPTLPEAIREAALAVDKRARQM